MSQGHKAYSGVQRQLARTSLEEMGGPSRLRREMENDRSGDGTGLLVSVHTTQYTRVADIWTCSRVKYDHWRFVVCIVGRSREYEAEASQQAHLESPRASG